MAANTTPMYSQEIKDALLVGGADGVRQLLMGKKLAGESVAVVAGSSLAADLLGLRQMVERLVGQIIDQPGNAYVGEWTSQTLAVGLALFFMTQVGPWKAAGAGKKGDLMKAFMVAGFDSALAGIMSKMALPLLSDVADM